MQTTFRMGRSAGVALVSVALCSASATAWAADWPQWRGLERDAVAPGLRLGTDWLDAPLQPLWRVALGEGYSAPVVLGERLYTFGREVDHEVVQAHDLHTGKVRWRSSYPAPYQVHENAGEHGAGPRSTPIAHGDLLYTVGINEVVHCWDTATGRVRWRIDFPRRFDTSPPGFGACSSPLIYQHRLLLPVADRVVAVGGQSGAVLWRALDDTFYSSLITATLAGQPQLVALARYRLVGLDLQGGEELWSHPFSSMYGLNVATPCVWQDRIIISSPARGTRALRVHKRGRRFVVEPVWQTQQLRCYMSSPVVYQDYLYGMDESGQLVCLSMEDGRSAWAEGNFGDYSSLVLAGDQLLVLSDSGDLTALEATPRGYRPLGEQSLADTPTWAHLVIAHGRLFVRDRKGLSCFAL
jgi:outer membrane protein assembly factor BamB